MFVWHTHVFTLIRNPDFICSSKSNGSNIGRGTTLAAVRDSKQPQQKHARQYLHFPSHREGFLYHWFFFSSIVNFIFKKGIPSERVRRTSVIYTANPLSPVMTAKLAKTDPSRVSEVPATASIDRSTEFLSCAKTALKIGKNRHKDDPNPTPPNAWWEMSPTDLRLMDPTPTHTRSNEILEYGLALLRTMESELKQLESLVRRRGQTNDPTQAIATSTRRLEQDTKELTEWLPTIIPPTIRRNGQAYKHYNMIQEWFQQAANEQGKRLQEILKVRGKVLAEQARRRKQFQATSESKAGSTRKPIANNVNNNPLFQLAPPSAVVKTNYGNATNGKISSFHSESDGAVPLATTAAAPSSLPPSYPSTAAAKTNQRPPVAGGYSYYPAKPTGGYGSASPYAPSAVGGYGGGAAAAAGGMRQRRAAAAAATDSGSAQLQQEQELLLIRQQERRSQQRLREAREAEKGLASLVGVFGKMSVRG